MYGKAACRAGQRAVVRRPRAPPGRNPRRGPIPCSFFSSLFISCLSWLLFFSSCLEYLCLCHRGIRRTLSETTSTPLQSDGHTGGQALFGGFHFWRLWRQDACLDGSTTASFKSRDERNPLAVGSVHAVDRAKLLMWLAKQGGESGQPTARSGSQAVQERNGERQQRRLPAPVS